VARPTASLPRSGGEPPFDFLTWFEFTPGDAVAFDELLHRLRETPEWRYVEREVDCARKRLGGPRCRFKRC
jgi:hypothetical protein